MIILIKTLILWGESTFYNHRNYKPCVGDCGYCSAPATDHAVFVAQCDAFFALLTEIVHLARLLKISGRVYP